MPTAGHGDSRAERAAARVPVGAARVLAAWVCHLRGTARRSATRARRPRSAPAAGPLREALPRVLAARDPALGTDLDVVTTISGLCEQLVP